MKKKKKKNDVGSPSTLSTIGRYFMFGKVGSLGIIKSYIVSDFDMYVYIYIYILLIVKGCPFISNFFNEYIHLVIL